MPHHHRARPAAAALAGAALLVSLTGCSLVGGGAADGAHQAAEEYAALVASPDDLEALWARTATEEPALVRAAGRMLAGASERIVVLGVGEAQPAGGSVPIPYDSDLDAEEARQVVISYRLDGSEHDQAVVLAPHEDQPLDEPATWAVVTPLLGNLTVPAAGLGSIVPDLYVSGVHAQVGDDFSTQGLPLYPAVYELQQRADPYLAGEPQVLTVAAGEAVELPSVPMDGTEETRAMLTEDLVSDLEVCHLDMSRCGWSTEDLVQQQGLDPALHEWSFEVTTAPALTLEGTRAEFDGGVLALHGPEGEIEVAFAGTVPWTIDVQSWQPVVLGYQMEIRAVTG